MDTISMKHCRRVGGLMFLAGLGQGIALGQPRDIAVVIDLSGSMNDDSQAWHTRTYVKGPGEMCPGLQVNLRDIWCAMDGPEPNRPYLPGPEDATQYAFDTGPTFGIMTNWGSHIVAGSYDPTTDAGLYYIPKGATCTDPAVISSLTARGYTSAERAALLSGSKDNTAAYKMFQYHNRVGAILGLATWKSGKPGALYHPGGNGDDVMDNAEIGWIAYPPYRRTWTWPAYVDFMASVGDPPKPIFQTDGRFRNRFGLKTWIDYVLEDGDMTSQTTNLWQTPEQPLRSVKDGVLALTKAVAAKHGGDHISLETFGTQGGHEVDLTSNLPAVAERLYEMQSGQYDTNTNVGGGLAKAIAELTSARARPNAAKVIVIATNGVPNTDGSGNFGLQLAEDYAASQAQLAASLGIRVFSVGVGCGADWTLMQLIAELTGGRAFAASDGPEQYARELGSIFRRVGELTGCEPCDMNCDGTVNVFDVDAFVAALSPAAATGCSGCAGDTNWDGSVNGFDIQAFVGRLGG